MGLYSIQYLVFLVVVAAVYLHLPQRVQPPFLLAASWVFYAVASVSMGSAGYLAVTLAICAFSYLCGRGLGWRGGAHKKAFVRLGRHWQPCDPRVFQVFRFFWKRRWACRLPS